MLLRRMAPVMIVGMALAMPCFAQDAAGGGAPGGGAPGGGAAGGGMISMTADSFVQEVDTNHDGKISKEEWKAAGLPEHVFTRLDAQKTGFLTKEQLEGTKYPDAMDTDKSGVLSVAKMVAFDKKMSGGAAGGGAPGGAPAGGGPGGGAPGGGGPQN